MSSNRIGTDVRSQFRAIAEASPEIHRCLDQDRVELACERLVPTSGAPDDFGEARAGGRGESYVVAQQSVDTRARGINRLLDLLAERGRADSSVIVDLLGGDGLVHKVAGHRDDPRIIATCDASPFMVEAAWAAGIPAVLQRAEESVFRTGSVGGVLLAYGTHHISPSQRDVAVAEAFRVLQPGGAFLLHDFPTGSPVDTWFAKVVDFYAPTGHAYAHFTSEDASSHLVKAGFEEVDVLSVDDSFSVWGATQADTELELGRYLVNMYGLSGLIEELGTPAAYHRAYDLALNIFQYPEAGPGLGELWSAYDEARGAWRTVMPRRALVGVGRKPHRDIGDEGFKGRSGRMS